MKAWTRTLTIGQVALLTGVSTATIRLYEREGLLEDPPRRDSGYREYREEVVALVRYIRRAKEVGFSLAEIADLLSLRVSPESACPEVRSRAQIKLGDIRERVRTLRDMERRLTKLVRS